MGILYTNHLEIQQLEGYNIAELEEISGKLEEELYEFYNLDDNTFSWNGKNGIEYAVFENISKEYKNVLFKVKSARTEDFNFENTDITYFWFLNGNYTKSNVELKPMLSENAIKDWIKSKTVEHIHDFNILSKVIGTKYIVMSCKCGEALRFKRDDTDDRIE